MGTDAALHYGRVSRRQLSHTWRPANAYQPSTRIIASLYYYCYFLFIYLFILLFYLFLFIYLRGGVSLVEW